MRASQGSLLLSATDLAGHLACAHLTQLDRRAAAGELRPPARRDPMREILEERGRAHEAAYLDYLAGSAGLEVARLDAFTDGADAVEATIAAMRRGVAAIAQGTLRDGRWLGRPDVLLRVARPSDLGDWSYEAADTKLAAETRGGTVLQLCLYSELVARVQSLFPEFTSVVAPGRYADPERLRLADFLAYYRWVRRRLEGAVDAPDAPAGTYPEPVPHCDVCRWWPACDRRRRDDDHLSLVAGATLVQRRELAKRGLDTVVRLAGAGLPLDPPPRGSREAYERVHAQARLQVDSRGSAAPRYEPIEPIARGRGLARLPEPSRGDVFFDLEGDPFVEGGGREYLFGWAVVDEGARPLYRRRWALDGPSERAAFEEFVDEVVARRERHPDLHVYHFAPYEPAALKRLMGRHGTREAELDRLLRGECFVDLHALVRQGFRVGVESYTLKALESLHGFARELDLREASANLRGVERALELGHRDAIPAACRAAVEAYNRDDCLSTWSLRGWLEARRDEVVRSGRDLPRPLANAGDPSAALDERQRRTAALFERLTRDLPADPAARDASDFGRWLLAHLLDWHRREGKSWWWEWFRLLDLAEDDLFAEKKALAGLALAGRVGGTDACPVHRYRFPEQDHDVHRGDDVRTPENVAIGAVADLDLAGRTIDLRKRGAARDLHPGAVLVHDYVGPGALPESLERIAVWVAENGAHATGPHRAARDLLLRIPPRVGPAQGGSLVRDGEELLDASRRLVLELDHGVLPVQGPPGAGKTYMGARMICALVRAGKKVGVTAVSHRVIRNLLDATLEAAREEGVALRCMHKVNDPSADPPAGIVETKDNDALATALRTGTIHVGAGTAWAWARPEFADIVDVLVVDEAGQMSLANAVAAAPAAKGVVLLGDPQQLEQPIQGSHPEGSDVSALEHLLGGEKTMPDDRGLFLAETWRLPPAICAFTSEIFYEGRLRSRPGCEGQRLAGDSALAGAGLWLVPVEHEGNQSAAVEEVEAVGRLVDSLLARSLSWVNAKGVSAPLRPDDVLIIAPYNAQVARLATRLPHARVGTVDRFQGQEAPVVIYSMTTSSADLAPRGMEFLYSLHRLNVATSRARCACLVVASPRLLEPDCRTPQAMRLANALCRYAELARRVELP
jgi:predicted RecB family nuclease